jgi:hypothetical protein
VALVALAAALLVPAVPATAAAAPGDATVFVQSAESGKLGGGRLVLAGVSGRVSFATNTGRAGVIPLRSLHRRLIPPGKPATGTLHIAGQRGGQELAFRLSRPRYTPPATPSPTASSRCGGAAPPAPQGSAASAPPRYRSSPTAGRACSTRPSTRATPPTTIKAYTTGTWEADPDKSSVCAADIAYDSKDGNNTVNGNVVIESEAESSGTHTNCQYRQQGAVTCWAVNATRVQVDPTYIGARGRR